MDKIDMAGHLIRRLNQQSTQVFQSQVQEAGFDITSVQFAALDTIAQEIRPAWPRPSALTAPRWAG